MKYYIIAGEASGDLHGSNLIKNILLEDAQADIRAWGGDLMAEAGAQVVKHYRDLAFMGFVEVIKHLGTILNNIKTCKKDIAAFEPDVLILIDYPGFNLRIAEWAKQQGFKIVYYISPTLWAWKENRIHQIKRNVDEMVVVLPFEQEYYKKHDYKVNYFGHPLTEVIEKAIKKVEDPISEKPIIALLPGSREQELKKSLPVMMQLVNEFPEYQFIVAQAPSLPLSSYQPYISGMNIQVIQNATYTILKQAKAAIVTSGTATLETALLGVPQIVCYRANTISYEIAKRLLKIKYISLVNLILNKPAIKELIQHDFNAVAIKEELDLLLTNVERIEQIQSDYTKLWEILAQENVSHEIAKKVVEVAQR